MRSAEDFTQAIFDLPTKDWKGGLDKADVSALIRARDREIVEQCKEKVHAAVQWNEYPVVDYVLDCILHDLG